MAQHKARESFPSVLEDSDVRQYWAGLTIYVTCYVTGFFIFNVCTCNTFDYFSLVSLGLYLFQLFSSSFL